jgi:integrase
MPARASLEPVKVNQGRKRPWMLSVPAAYSSTGKRQRLFFRSKAEADGQSEILKARRDNFGASLGSMTPVLIAKAAEAYDRLAESGFSLDLLDAVEIALEHYRQRKGSITFMALREEFLLAKKKRSPEYLRDTRTYASRFPELDQTLVCDILPKHLEKTLQAQTDSVCNAMVRHLGAIFNFGISKGYLSENPIRKDQKVHIVRGEVRTIDNETAEKMLNDCLQHDLELLPLVALGLFCGIRPDGEVYRLDWSDIHLDPKEGKTEVVLPAAKTKTKGKRFIDLSENAGAWLQLIPPQQRVGKVLKMTVEQARTRAAANWNRVTKEPRIKSGCRHTYCSNWLAFHGDIDRLCLQTGHRDPKTMWDHYYKAVRKSEAEKFWQIYPPVEEAQKIVPFAG